MSRKTLIGAVCLLCAAAGQAHALERGYEEALADIAALGPRRENGDAERATFAYVERRLRAAGLEVASTGFALARGAYSRSRIVEARIGGERRDELALIAPVSSWRDSRSGEEGAAAIALALVAAERFAAAGRSPPIGLRFVFLGAERRGKKGEGEDASLGSRTWLASLGATGGRAALYLSLDGNASRLSLVAGGNRVLAPPWLYERARACLAAAGIAADAGANRMQLYRLGFVDRPGPAATYLDAGFPAVELRGEAGGAGEPRLDGRRLEAFVDAFVAANAGGLPQDWDRHYLTARIGERVFVFGERGYLAFVLGFLTLMTVIILALTLARRSYAKPIIARLPLIISQTLALYAALAVVYLLGSAVSRFDGLALGASRPWIIAPRIFAGARILSSLLLFLAFVSFLVERRALTANPFFYELAALLCLGVDVLAFSSVNLTVSFPFIWAFAAVAVSLLTRRARATIVAYVAMLSPLVFFAVEIYARPEPGIYRSVLDPGISGSFALAGLSLPFFIFTASPLLFFAPRGALARRRVTSVLFALAVVVEGAALAAASQADREGGLGRGSVIVSEALDQEAGTFVATLEGKRRLGAGILDRGGRPLAYAAAGDRAELAGADRQRRAWVEQSRAYFLDRCTDTVRIRFAFPPDSVRLSLRGDEELGIYDCDRPYRISLDGKSAEIFVEDNPGREIVLPLTVPRSFSASLEVTALYLEPIVPYSFPEGGSPRPGRFTLRAAAKLSGAD